MHSLHTQQMVYFTSISMVTISGASNFVYNTADLQSLCTLPNLRHPDQMCPLSFSSCIPLYKNGLGLLGA